MSNVDDDCQGRPPRLRAAPCGIRLDACDAAAIKGMLARGDAQHFIAAWFGVNPGRVAEISSGVQFADVLAAAPDHLPPAGPYEVLLPVRDFVGLIEDARAACRQIEAAQGQLACALWAVENLIRPRRI